MQLSLVCANSSGVWKSTVCSGELGSGRLLPFRHTRTNHQPQTASWRHQVSLSPQHAALVKKANLQLGG